MVLEGIVTAFLGAILVGLVLRHTDAQFGAARGTWRALGGLWCRWVEET